MTREEFIEVVKDTGTKAYGEVTVFDGKIKKATLTGTEKYNAYYCYMTINGIEDFKFWIAFYENDNWYVQLIHNSEESSFMTTEESYDTLEKALASVKPSFYKQFCDIIQMYYKLSNEEAPL